MDKHQTDIELELETIKEIPSGAGIFDVTNSVIDLKYLNAGFYQMIGTRREDRERFFGKNTIQSVHPDDRPGMFSEIADAIRENRPFEYQFRNLDGAGEYIWIGIRASHKTLSAETERFYASYYNVSQYISRQNELEDYGSHLNTILGNIPGGVVVFFEREGEIRLEYANAGFYALHHGSAEYWAGQSANPVDWLVPEDQELFWEEFRKVKSGEKTEGSVVYRVTGEDGLPHWVWNQFRRAYQRENVQYYYSSFIDMDRQVAAEQEILRDKQMYDDAALSAKLIIWSYDPRTRQAAMMRSGYTEIICRKLKVPYIIDNVVDTLVPYVYPDDQEVFREVYRKIDNGEESAECEFRFRMPSHEAWQRERLILKRVNDKNGRLLSFYGYGQNITEQRQSEEKFNRAYARIENPNSYGSFHLNLTKNWCGDGSAGKSGIKTVLDLQKSGTVDGYFKAFAGVISDDAVQVDFFERFDRRKLLEGFERGTERVTIEYPVIYENGKKHWREGFLDMIKNPGTGDIEAITYSNDIDAKKRDEFIMNKLIHEHFDYIGIIHPKEKTFEFRSRKPWITYGEVGEELLYEKCVEFIRNQFVKEDERIIFDRAVALDNITRDLNASETRVITYLKTEDAKTSCIRLQYSWLEEKGGEILVLRSDVTESYQEETRQIELLEKGKRAAEAASIAKSEFLSRMSHDIRTPLNGIMGMTYLAKKQSNPARTADCLEKIDTSSRFLLSLVNDVLDMAKAESGKITLSPEPYTNEEFENYINSIIAPLCEERGQTFSYEPVVTLSNVVPLYDKLRANQVVFNLLSNAIKYTPEGGEIRFRLFQKKLSEKHMMEHIEIIDNGIGMSEEFQKVLFEPFTRESREDFAEARGTGLGLAITKQLVDAMGGKISVSSRPGVGTTFRLEFYIDCVPAAGAENDTEQDLRRDIRISGKHILLCEDHPLNQEIAKLMLEEKWALVTVAGDGQEGLKAFLNSSIGYFDCILMDIHMPVMDGYETAKTIRKLPRADAKSVPIIAMTADAFAEDIQKCLDVGMNGHIAKPVDPEKLYKMLERTSGCS